MGGNNMTSLKIILLPLAICLLLSLNSQVTGKPSPKHFLIETKEKIKKNNDYTGNVTNKGGKIGGIGDGSVNSGDYTATLKMLEAKLEELATAASILVTTQATLKMLEAKLEELATAASILVTTFVPAVMFGVVNFL